MNKSSSRRARAALKVALAAVAAAAPLAHADLTNIATQPLFTTSAVAPNIMFLMDDSGSMKRWFLPDRATYWWESNKYGVHSTQCNLMAYNPDVTYLVPPDASAPATSAGPYTYYKYKGTQTALGFAWNADGTVNWNTFYGECNSVIGDTASLGFSKFDTVVIPAGTPQAQNYANWKQWHSVRKEMAKTAVKHVFSRLDANYRIGFSKTSHPEAKDLTADPYAGSYYKWNFVDVKPFDSTHRNTFMTAVNNSDGDADTPLRGAVAKAGQYFANKAPLQTRDPILKSCQRNYAILATDGGWTSAGEKTSPRFGAYKEDGSPLGQQDQNSAGAPIETPFRDSGADGVATLADVAHYYYNTDLRRPDLNNCGPDSANNLCENNVPPSGPADDKYRSNGDRNPKQHLTLFTIGLGLNGLLNYREDYTRATTGDFHEIVNGTKQWPAIADPGSKNDYMPLAHTDDMWHAAVNGHGQHFSATDAVSLVKSLSAALDAIRAADGAGGAASTSAMQPVTGDNDAFVAQFTSQDWIGDLLAYKIDPITGDISGSKTWSARSNLDAATSRTIYYMRPGATPGEGLRNFDKDTLTSDGLVSNFTGFCTRPGANPLTARPEQCGWLKPTDLDAANSAERMIDYLRGDQTLAYFRKRASRLGDIVNSSPAFVGKPGFPYADPTYKTFVNNQKDRAKAVLVGSNDGMLHAFNPADGTERWAFVPRAVMPNLYVLGDTNYPNNHRYFVDGSPVVADIKVGGSWKTIVVGGLNAGGRSYYALDITDPSAPKALWEFSHLDNSELGLTFSKPIVTQNKDGVWVVVFGSGYNNVSPGSGNGQLFVLDAATGNVLRTLPTLDDHGAPVGSAATPSGLVHINAWVDEEGENKALRFYGGDLLGNLWRFDPDDRVLPAGSEAHLLAKLKSSTGKAQPVTTRPVLAELKVNGYKYPVVYVGTGQYLGSPDLDASKFVGQSIYAIKDPLDATSWGVFRNDPKTVEHTFENTTDAGKTFWKVKNKPVEWADASGWFLDFPTTGERVNINPVVALETLYVATNIPESNSCTSGGSSYLYEFNIITGAGQSSELSTKLVQGLTVTQRADGGDKGAVDTLETNSDGTITRRKGKPPVSSSGLKRVSWRELVE